MVHRPFGSGMSGSASSARRGEQPQGGDPALVQVYVRKMRNKAAGRIGDALLRYERSTGRYADEQQG